MKINFGSNSFNKLNKLKNQDTKSQISKNSLPPKTNQEAPPYDLKKLMVIGAGIGATALSIVGIVKHKKGVNLKPGEIPWKKVQKEARKLNKLIGSGKIKLYDNETLKQFRILFDKNQKTIGNAIKNLGRRPTKIERHQMSPQFYKDRYIVENIIPAKGLKRVRDKADKNLERVFNNEIHRERIYSLNSGVMIYGDNQQEKKKLFDFFLNQAKENDFHIIRIPTNGFKSIKTPWGEHKPLDVDNVHKVAGAISDLIPKAKEEFLKNKKHTMFILENADDVYRQNSKALRALNINTDDCGRKGVTVLATANTKDFYIFEQSTLRNGRADLKMDTNNLNIIK